MGIYFGCTSESEIPAIVLKTLYTFVVWLINYKYDHKNEPYFWRFSNYLNEYWFQRKTFPTILVVCKSGASGHSVIGWITEHFVSKVLAILPSASRRSWRSVCRLVQVLFACFTRYTISSSTDSSFTLIGFWIWL